MNRFRTRRKAKDDNASTENDGGSVPYLSGRTFRRKQKAAAQKPEVDLSQALPSSENFRTSLLMPKMTARFSMLREQDDPTSKIGKASDDSVILNRASRLADLLDLPEDGSVRPPFARERLASYASGDGYTTDDDSMYNGSIISRARPGEGNVLFGGRQKVYKIPVGGAGSTKELNGSGTRFLYEHDVHSSAFQSFREDRKRNSHGLDVDGDEEPRESIGTRSGTRSDSPPPYGYNRNRETSSSSGSGPSIERSSTAATSVASQVVGGTPVNSSPASSSPALASPAAAGAGKPQRVATKSRRLYDHGLDQQIHEQQSSALSRLDQLARQRAVGAASTPPLDHSPSLSQANSVSNLRERFDRNGALKPNAPAFRAVNPSPPTTAVDLGSFNFGLTDGKSLGSAARPNGPQSPPLTPVGNESDSGIGPTDKVKAVAAGPFSGPAGSDDEHQYAPRHLQTHGRLATETLQPADSGTSIGVSLLKALGGVGNRRIQGDGVLGETPPPSAGLSLAPSSASLSSIGTESERIPGLQQGIPRRGSEQGVGDIREQGGTRHGPPAAIAATDPFDLAANASLPVPDLRGLVRQHLRTDSGQSSIHTALTPVRSRSALNGAGSANDPALPELGSSARSSAAYQEDHDATTHGLPSDFALNSKAVPSGDHDRDSSYSVAPLKLGAHQHREDAEMQPHAEADQLSALIRDHKVQHTRNPSSETQKAREEFANELAQRRKMVQENLKSFVETENRVPSPPREKSKTSHKRLSPLGRSSSGIGIWKSKPASASSPTPSTTPKPATLIKARKKLGVAGSQPTTDSPRADTKYGLDQSNSDEGRTAQNISRGPDGAPIQTRDWGQIRRDARRELERRKKEIKEAGGQTAGSKTPSPPSSSGGSARDRSGSDASAGRSRAGDGPAGDESRVAALKAPDRFGIGLDPTQKGPRQPYMRFSPRGPSPSAPGASAGRLPGGAPSQPPGLRKMLLPERLEAASPLAIPPRPSPIAPYSANSTPSLNTSPASSSKRSPTQEFVQTAGTVPLHCKKVVQKSDISEPTLIASTSDITTVDLPPGASLSNGAKEASPPPLPPINPRRKTRTLISKRGADKSQPTPPQALTPSSAEEEKSTFSDDDDPPPRSRLWKPSSEGGSLNARHRHQAPIPPTPRMAPYARDQQRGPPPAAVSEGDMF